MQEEKHCGQKRKKTKKEAKGVGGKAECWVVGRGRESVALQCHVEEAPATEGEELGLRGKRGGMWGCARNCGGVSQCADDGQLRRREVTGGCSHEVVSWWCVRNERRERWHQRCKRRG